MTARPRGSRVPVLLPLAAHLTGGSTFSCLLLASRLPSRGFEPIIALHGDGPVGELARAAGVATYPSSVNNLVGTQHPIRQGADIVRARQRIRAELSERQIALVHTNDARLHRLWGPAARSTGRGWVWHQRTPGLTRGMAALSLVANDIITISHFARDSLPTRVRRRCHVIDNPFEQPERSSMPALRETILTQPGARRPRFIVGMVSNLKAPRKRPETFIRIAGALRDAGVDAVYPLVGELPAARRRELEELAALLEVDGSVVFYGRQTPAHAWIAACDVIVAPAVEEAFGRVLVEAAMLGVPVVAADDGGHREIIDQGRTGLLFAPDDVADATRAVQRLLSDAALRERIAEQSQASARERFSVEAHTDAVVERYMAVLGRRR